MNDILYDLASTPFSSVEDIQAELEEVRAEQKRNPGDNYQPAIKTLERYLERKAQTI